jgi:mono/diheme cytochrome c family protein
MIARILAAFAMSAVVSHTALAQEPGDAGKGLAYVTQVCAQCHAVRPGDKFSPNPKAPSFEDIAKTSGVTGISLAASLHSIHENMPAFVLSMNERDNIIAYILSLKGLN